MKNKIRKISMIIMWLLIWQMAAILIHNKILLAGPIEVAEALLQLIGTLQFYKICLYSMGRILTGFIMAFLLGVAVGALTYRSNFIREMLQPLLHVIKSIPVASFVVLLLIWQGAENLSVWISFLVVFPNACISTRNGLEAVNPQLKEMADIFGIHGVKRVIYIYRPSLIKFLYAGMEVAVGMAFKSGVAAEVIGVPDFSIGERIYMSKIYLDTPGLFAWTIVLIILSSLAEKLILKILRSLLVPVKIRSVQIKENLKIKEEPDKSKTIRLSHISKAFEEKSVLSDINRELNNGGCYLLMGPSGSGKTTLLRLLAGLETEDEGSIEKPDGMKVTYLFQEDRLLENELTITNIMLTAKELRLPGGICGEQGKVIGRRQMEELLAGLLPADCLEEPAGTLSGGMKRRCALARTLFYLSDRENTLCLLDEPFAGLDEETKKQTAAFIRQYRQGRTLIVATHDEKDVQLLGGEIWRIAESH
jgi:NitT/TauT family transport system permease protein